MPDGPKMDESARARSDLGHRSANAAHDQRAEVMGGLAAGIAHELNTPAQFLGDNVRFLAEAFHDVQKILTRQRRILEAARDVPGVAEALRELEAHCEEIDFYFTVDEASDAIDAAVEGLDRIGDIVHSLKAYAQNDGARREPLNINQAVRSAVLVSRGEWREIANVVTKLDALVADVICNPAEISSALLNLVVNAAHALADAQVDGQRGRGTITIATQARDGGVAVTVTDDGPGMSVALKARILEPFFTTKASGRGTGLGLPLARASIVDRHGGTLRCESSPGEGASFEIWLPSAPRGWASRGNAR